MPPVAPTILVIDDEELVLETMALSLERVGFHVLRADSAEEARRLATTSTLELIQSTPDVKALSELAANDEIWVKY